MKTSPSEYRPMFDGRRVTCPCCEGRGVIYEDLAGVNVKTPTDCGLCGGEGAVPPARARRYLLDMSDYAGLDKVVAAVDAWYAQRQALRDNALPTDTPRRRRGERMYR